ncbi:pentapeptide repeat-containing protein [Streptomyces sp. NPDC000888]
MTLLVVGALSYLVYGNVYGLLAHAARDQEPRKPVNINDAIKTTFTILTLIGAVLAGIYAYRKQRLAEGDAHRADASQLADRYTSAAEQLGHDQAAVRLAGVYALARLADDWIEQRQVCIDVLCAYLRMPYQPDPAEPGHKAGEREVRHTINGVIRDHLFDPAVASSWCECVFDFTGARFDNCNLSFSHFFGTVLFTGVTFSGHAQFDGVTFSRAMFGGLVDFDAATFRDSVSFSDATFDGTVAIGGATFSGDVSFGDATFSNSIYFGGATFNGSVDFGGATFNGYVDFSNGTFRGHPRIVDAPTFSSAVSFFGATFRGGLVDFGGATFRSTVTFEEATFGSTDIRWGPLRRPSGT